MSNSNAIAAVVGLLAVAGVVTGLTLVPGVETAESDSANSKPGLETIMQNSLTVDLCGNHATTEDYLREELRSRREQAFAEWVADTIKLPANVRFCDGAGEPRILRDVPWFLVQRVDDEGHADQPLLEVGIRPEGGAGFRYTTVNILPKIQGDPNPTGLVFAYR